MITAATVRAVQGTGSAAVVAAHAAKPEVLVIDDHSFILAAWQDKLGSEVKIHPMTSQEDLVAKIKFTANGRSN